MIEASNEQQQHNNNECTKSANPRCLHGHCTELKLFPACIHAQQLCFWLYS